ncbi:DUF2249 domain-containing protein [bacterium]|nr:MAG: DUF2249 domain-containing protein [bacterium]
MEKILDVRQMAPKERHPNIFNTYKALAPGEQFILINDHEPKPLLYQFQSEHDGEFEWWVLEQGPEAWRVAIAKRTVNDPHRTVTDYFETDHRRLDAIFARFKAFANEQKWNAAAGAFSEFSLGLKRHIKAEEEILFPAFEQKTGMIDSGPTFVMKMEHKDIKELLDKILSAARSSDEATATSASNGLLNLLGDHNMKEEHILYPESDSFLDDSERAQVIKKTQAI